MAEPKSITFHFNRVVPAQLPPPMYASACFAVQAGGDIQVELGSVDLTQYHDQVKRQREKGVEHLDMELDAFVFQRVVLSYHAAKALQGFLNQALPMVEPK